VVGATTFARAVLGVLVGGGLGVVGATTWSTRTESTASSPQLRGSFVLSTDV
jgi:hypothetical protein